MHVHDNPPRELFNFPTLTKRHGCVRLSTCEEYLRTEHGPKGVVLLKHITKAPERPQRYPGLEGRIKVTATSERVTMSLPRTMEGFKLFYAMHWICLVLWRNPCGGLQASSGEFIGNLFVLDTLYPLSNLSRPDTSCWSKLFGSAWWLSMRFQDMLRLSAIEYPVSSGPGIVFMGYSIALASELQATKGKWSQTQNVGDLSERVLLGWCPEARIVLGTDEAPKALLAQSSALAQLGGQVGFSFSRSSNTIPIQFSPSGNYVECLRNSTMEQIIVYDTMLLVYSEDIPSHEIRSDVPRADPGGSCSNNGDLASFEALKDKSSLVIEGSGCDELTVRDLIMGFSINISKALVHKPSGRRIYGYEFMDVVRDSPPNELLERQGLAWSPLLGELDCLFCSNFGDAIKGNRDVCLDSPCNRVLTGQDMMAAPTSSITAMWTRYPSLQLTLQASGQRLSDKGGGCWIPTGTTTFEKCSHQKGQMSC
ncbi:hypothetical protein BJY01DRAFT_241106 [Aspergillus pseudoustus]|uniref:Uncharacterized protein n=1 Tax=Aspergillus pseudoustus TaxID=1810923 RepID=A0ABR4IIT4_9EURO